MFNHDLDLTSPVRSSYVHIASIDCSIYVQRTIRTGVVKPKSWLNIQPFEVTWKAKPDVESHEMSTNVVILHLIMVMFIKLLAYLKG